MLFLVRRIRENQILYSFSVKWVYLEKREIQDKGKFESQRRRLLVLEIGLGWFDYQQRISGIDKQQRNSGIDQDQQRRSGFDCQ